MEPCMEAKALKSSLRRELAVNSSQRQQVSFDDFGVVSAEDFEVDDLLDLSSGEFEEGFGHKLENEDLVSVPVDDVSDFSFSAGGDPDDFLSGELAVPDDDIAGLEWVSRFVDDSVPELSLLYPVKRSEPGLRPGSVNFPKPVPVKARTKRPRATGRGWSLGSNRSSSSSTSSVSSGFSSSTSSLTSPIRKPGALKSVSLYLVLRVMKTLAIPSSGITDLLVFRHTPKLVRVRLSYLALATHPNIFSLSSNSNPPQVDIGTADNESPDIHESKTVPVKFQMQKECLFGDEFLVVGDDHMFGSWDPENGIPLTWSEGHVWAVELDVPIGKRIQFKFILKASTGAITWQPGPDRTFRSWETNNTITLCEDWEDPQRQRLIEVDRYPLLNQNEDSTVNSQVLAAAQKLTYTKEEQVAEISNGSAIADNSSYLAGKCSSETPDELVFARSIPSQEDKPMTIVADNIGIPEKDSVVNAANESLDSKDYVDNPVLVPGLTYFSSFVETEDAVQTKSSSVGVSDGCNDAKNSNLFELEKKQEVEEEDHSILERQPEPLSHKAEDVEIEEEHHDILKQRLLLAIEEEQARSELNKVIVNGIRWGRRALQKLLANLGSGLG